MTKIFTIVFLALGLTFFLAFLNQPGSNSGEKNHTPLHAGNALATWFEQRSFPGTNILMTGISDGFISMTQNNARTASFPGAWEQMGPKNFGGRTLALCFNPQNSNTMYAGAASGSLWRTYTGGAGATAWEEVPVGFPVLGVAAIAINPMDTNEIFIGTGEVYNDQNTGTGIAVRTTRGTYGIGILKSTDNGITWSKSLDWQYDEMKGVADIIMNPLRPATLFAATTEGTFRSYDSGQSWTLVQTSRMATDLLMVPGDTSIVFIAAGNTFSQNAGIYRSTNGGTNFVQITSGLPPVYTGKAMLDVCASNTQVMYASIANQLVGIGLFRSDDGGLNWYQVNNTNYADYQGWYSHDVLIKPSDPDMVLVCGINMWKSYDGGVTLNQKSYWGNWDFNATTVGGSEGPFDYVHSDIHRMYFDPQDEEIVYVACDGGIFRSIDGGESYEGRNGGYQTQQFYANFSCSATDSLFAIGGLQDNATAVYDGNDGWRRVIGGDGLSTAISPVNDQVVYGSSQYLNMYKSNDHAQNFNFLNIPGNNFNPFTNFAGPFVLCPSAPAILYAGRDIVYKTTNTGQLWNPTNNNNVLDSNAVLVLEVSDSNPDLVYAATAPVTVPQVGLFKTTNGGTGWSNVTAGIPNRYIVDVEINPGNNDIVYVALSGFGTPHVFKTTNGGLSWNAFGSGLPDVPVNTITTDPLNTSIMYLGNDLGIYASLDGGLNWQPFNDGLIDATLVMDISISPLNRKLRLATHGKGVYERDMLPVSITGINADNNESNEFYISPNPATSMLRVNLESTENVSGILIYDLKGNKVKVIAETASDIEINIEPLLPGKYFIVVEYGQKRMVKPFIKL